MNKMRPWIKRGVHSEKEASIDWKRRSWGERLWIGYIRQHGEHMPGFI